jgi:3-hydroxyacyl-[acyl-carrier-protein] dehydratase
MDNDRVPAGSGFSSMTSAIFPLGPKASTRSSPVAAKDLIVDPSLYDLNHVLADIEEIRRYNPQRYEMEQLTAIVYEDFDRRVCVGYKDHGPNEFWTRGHMPGMPLLPGVLMCEAAAQMCSYYTIKYDLLGTKIVGFGGMDEVRFRDTVRPGDRLVIAVELLKLRRGAMVVSRFQGFVRESLVCEGQIKGVPLPSDLLSAPAASGL